MSRNNADPWIVLYHPKSNASAKRILPMSLLALGAVLENRFRYQIVDGNCIDDPLAAIRDCVKEGARVLAVTVMPGPQLLQAVPHCRALKREFPGLTIIWGGYFPTQHASACLNSPEIEIVVRGHGELVFLELMQRLQRDEDYRQLEGLAFRDGSGSVVENPLAPIPHPESLPPYPYHRLEMTRYLRNTFLGSRTLPHHSSYGCPFLCNFCAVVNMVNGRWLPQSADTVARTARLYVQRWGVNAIEFCDNNFFTHEARVKEIAERIAPLGLSWWGEARVDTLLKYPDETWRLMRKSGLKMVFMGAESASAEILNRMDKGGTLTPEKTLEIAAVARHHGVIPEFSFVLGNPPEPAADVQSTLEFVRKLKKINPDCEIILYNYSPVPLSGNLYDTALSGGFAFPQTLDDWISPKWAEFSQRRGAGVPWVDQDLRLRVRNFERVLNAYYPTATDIRLTPFRRGVLRAASAWRFHLKYYDSPLELRALQKILHYQRPETSGF
jgi:hypothetical protein